MKKRIIILYAILAVLSVTLHANAATNTPINTTKKPAQVAQSAPSISTTPLEVVQNPAKFLNKRIVMNGKFDKFSTLGLDYKKAFRDSNKYIGFMLQRDDVKDHNIPLSELKLFMARQYAEKFIDLSTGDKVKITGKVFSNALNDPWVDIEKLEVIEKTAVKKTEN